MTQDGLKQAFERSEVLDLRRKLTIEEARTQEWKQRAGLFELENFTLRAKLAALERQAGLAPGKDGGLGVDQ